MCTTNYDGLSKQKSYRIIISFEIMFLFRLWLRWEWKLTQVLLYVDATPAETMLPNVYNDFKPVQIIQF